MSGRSLPANWSYKTRDPGPGWFKPVCRNLGQGSLWAHSLRGGEGQGLFPVDVASLRGDVHSPLPKSVRGKALTCTHPQAGPRLSPVIRPRASLQSSVRKLLCMALSPIARTGPGLADSSAKSL